MNKVLTTVEKQTLNSLTGIERDTLIKLIEDYRSETQTNELKPQTEFSINLNKYGSETLFLLNIKNIINLNFDYKEKFCSFAEENLNIINHFSYTYAQMKCTGMEV